MATVTIKVCDLCQSNQDVREWTVMNASQKAQIDLCGPHSAPLQECIDMGTASPQKATQRKPGHKRNGQIVPTTLKDIEREKV